MLGAIKEEFDIGEGIRDLNLNENEARDPMNPVVRLTGQQTPRNLAEAKMAGDNFSSGSGYPQQASGSSKQACGPPAVLNCAPPQIIQVARFPKDQVDPVIVGKQTVDVTADQNRNDGNLNHIPDFRAEWGNDERWKNERKADRYYVTPNDMPDFPQLHGWYVVFSLHEPRYDSNTHKIFQGFGRHVHEDIFIAKLGDKIKQNGWTCYVDMPQEFLSAKSRLGWNLYWIGLEEHGNSMIGSLIA